MRSLDRRKELAELITKLKMEHYGLIISCDRNSKNVKNLEQTWRRSLTKTVDMEDTNKGRT